MAYRRSHYRRAHLRRNRYGGYSYVKGSYVSGHDFDKRGNAGNGGHIEHGNMNYKGSDSPKGCFYCFYELIWILSVLMMVPVPAQRLHAIFAVVWVLFSIVMMVLPFIIENKKNKNTEKVMETEHKNIHE